MIVADERNLQTYSSFEKEYCPVKEAESITSTSAQLLLKNSYEEKSNERDTRKQKLVSIKDMRSKAGWDGFNAKPVSSISLKNALIFLILSPERFALPAPGVCPNGHLTLEWRQQDGRLLSLAFDEKDRVNYIAFLPDGEIVGGEMSVNLGYNETLTNFLERIF